MSMDKDALTHKAKTEEGATKWQSQRELSAEIEKQTEAFLKAGGTIRQCGNGETGTGQFSLEQIEGCVNYITQGYNNVEIAKRLKFNLPETAILMDKAHKLIASRNGNKSTKKSRGGKK